MESVNLVYDREVSYTNAYVLEESKRGFRYDFYTHHLYPVNFDVRYATFDYHLPLYNLVKKYYPEMQVNRIGISELKKDDPFIYPINFTYLHSYLKEHTIPEMVDHLNPVIRSGWQENKGVLVLNDSHEYASYINIKGFSYVNVLDSFKGLDENRFDKIVISSGNLDNGCYTGTRYSGKNSSLTQRVANSVLNSIYNFNKDPRIRIYGFRFFEEVVAAQIKLFYPQYDFTDKLKSLQEGNSKHFICLNNINKDFRTVLCYKIEEQGLAGNFFLSHKKIEPGTYDEDFFSKWEKLVDKKSFAGFAARLPFRADTGVAVANPWYVLPWELLHKSFCWLVTETLYEGDIYSRCFFTEKIYKPMSIFMPFMLAAQPYSLYNLQQEGYATFGKWWDESYDTELDPVKRMELIMANLVSLSKLDQQGMVRMYKDMEEVLRHNYHHLLNTTAAEKYIKDLVHTYNSL